jgi:hypothetical protein
MGARRRDNKTSIRGECVIQIRESCITIFVEVTLPYTFTYENYSFENVQRIDSGTKFSLVVSGV